MKFTIHNIERDCQYILDICKGATTPLSAFYESNISGELVFASLIEELASYLPPIVAEEEKLLYRCFFEMSIAYLESACNPSDKVFLSLKKLSQINLVDTQQSGSVFRIMLEEAKSSVQSEKERSMIEICENSYHEFLQYAPTFYEKQKFEMIISSAVESFLGAHNLGMTDDEVSNSSIQSILNMTMKLIQDEYMCYRDQK